jgi:2-dehydro-3-deoxygluconokinase
MPKYDVVTFGETMLRLTPPDFRRIEQTNSFNVEIGGAESNTAVGLVRLGLKVAWLSRLPTNPLGKLVAQTIAGYGVDTSHVVWSDADRLGLYFWEESKPPRPNLVLYDRRHSAVSRMTPDQLPPDLFRPDNGRLLHLTGITPALSADAAATSRQAMKFAQDAGWIISFDVNFRSKLWSPEAARQGCQPFAQAAHLLFCPLRDAQTIYGIPATISHTEAVQRLAGMFPDTNVIMTLGSEGAIGVDINGRVIHQPASPAEVVDRLGSGDAFAAGVLYGYLLAKEQPGDLGHALRWGTAMAALKRTIPGDLPLIDKSSVAQFVSDAEFTSKDAR